MNWLILWLILCLFRFIWQTFFIFLLQIIVLDAMYKVQNKLYIIKCICPDFGMHTFIITGLPLLQRSVRKNMEYQRNPWPFPQNGRLHQTSVRLHPASTPLTNMHDLRRHADTRPSPWILCVEI